MTATRLLLFAAGLIGAAGIGLAAMATHAYAGTSLPVAATMLSLHAPAIIAVAAARKASLIHDLCGRVAAWGLVSGVVMFSGDIAMRTFSGMPLFPMAAPAGGTLLIAAWILVAVAGLIGGRHGS
ncbi:MAG: DUF423 domain-containing protein [Phreatobacter sp.]|uniref:DUF423 domain-containing protein n=1 Tax=Phreatobacter sp. TaxID=1966341 RepID=UPI001A56776C|nr:DUF423 domain-containing protein [Phreatobacter sp.]MBL8571791.1 DUF423 domain-containing protein [Phreatobacter sp.]